MKIAVTSEGKTAKSRVAPLTAPNTGFVIYDVNNLKFGFMNSSTGQPPFLDDDTQTARMMADAGVDVLVVGGISSETLGVLVKTGLRIYESMNVTVLEAIEALKLNLLPAIGNA